MGSRTPIVRDAVRLSYAPDAAPAADGQRYPLSVSNRVKLGNLSLREKRLLVKNFVLDQKIEIAGLQLAGQDAPLHLLLHQGGQRAGAQQRDLVVGRGTHGPDWTARPAD